MVAAPVGEPQETPVSKAFSHSGLDWLLSALIPPFGIICLKLWIASNCRNSRVNQFNLNLAPKSDANFNFISNQHTHRIRNLHFIVTFTSQGLKYWYM